MLTYAFQLVGTRIEGARLVLCMRVNVNTKVSTLEEVRERKKLELVGKAAMLVRETGTRALNLLVYAPLSYWFMSPEATG